MTITTAAEHLSRQGYYHGRLAVELGRDLGSDADWTAFASSWHRLKQDDYMADGGTYRFRRYSEFACDVDGIRLLPHVPYAQTRDVNYLNGGIERHYEPFEDDISTSPILTELIRWAVEQLDTVTAASTWKLQSFQNRIWARPGTLGKPTPEGVHRDGVDFVIALLVDRVGVAGGDSAVYDTERKRLANVVMTEPGEFIFNDDAGTLHGVKPLTTTGVEDGYRDVLVAMFTRQEAAA